MLQESLSTFRRRGDEVGAARSLGLLGNLASVAGEHDRARTLHAQSLAIRQSANDAREVGLSLLAMGLARWRAGEPEPARELTEQAVALMDRTDDGPGRAYGVTQLGYLAADAGHTAQACELQQRALGLWRTFAPRAYWSTACLLELAQLEGLMGEQGRVAAHLLSAREIFEHNGDRAGVEFCEAALRSAANIVLTAE
jgi:hypothetical protein